MNKDLIERVRKLIKQKDDEIYLARKKIPIIENKINIYDKQHNLDKVTKINQQRILIEGIRHKYKDLLSLKNDILINKYKMHTNDVNLFLVNIDRAIESTIKELRNEYNKLYELECTTRDVKEDIALRSNLEEELNSVLKTANDLTEEEFIKELFSIFHKNNFGGCYDTKDINLHYSIGQIFILKYTLNQILRYVNDDKIYINLRYQKEILDDYIFPCSNTYISNIEFVNNLKTGNISLCNLDKTTLSYEGATKLYRMISLTFNLPRRIGYKLRRIK